MPSTDARPGRWRRSLGLIASAGLAPSLLFLVVLWMISRPPKGEASFSSYKVSRLTAIGNVYDAVISPNGEFVTYVRDEDGIQSLWLRQIATGSDSTLIARGEARYWGLTFSPDGHYIYYVASRYSDAEAKRQETVLYRIGLIGGPALKLNENLDSPISFSPDGSRYAFVREYTSQHESALMVASLDGGAERQLASSELPDYLDFPSWSPDGRTIACVGASFRHPSQIVFYAAGAPGERHAPISATSWGHVRKIEWIKNGTGLLMAAKNRGSGDYQLWRLSYPGGDARRITNDLNSYVRLSMTADSRALVTVQETAASSIWLAPNGKTAAARQLTADAGHYQGLSWTANGQIVYAADIAGESNIWIMDADGKNRKQLTQGDRLNHRPVASPDAAICFSFLAKPTIATSPGRLGQMLRILCSISVRRMG